MEGLTQDPSAQLPCVTSALEPWLQSHHFQSEVTAHRVCNCTPSLPKRVRGSERKSGLPGPVGGALSSHLCQGSALPGKTPFLQWSWPTPAWGRVSTAGMSSPSLPCGLTPPVWGHQGPPRHTAWTQGAGLGGLQGVLGSRHTIFGWAHGPDTSPGFRSQAPTARRPLSLVFPRWGWAHTRREWWILHPNLWGPCHALFYPPWVGMAPAVSPALASPLHLRGWLHHFSASLGMWPHFQTPLWGVQLSYCKALISPSFVSPFRWPWILVPQPWRQLRTLVMKTTLILVTCFSPEQRELVSLWNTRVDDRDHGLSPSGHPWGRHNLSRTS